MSYSFESRVRFSEIGEDGCLTLPVRVRSSAFWTFSSVG